MLRKPVKVIKLAVWVAVTLVVAATFLALLWPRQTRLVLEEPDSGQLYACFPVEEGSRFSITFIHSVNKTPLTDVYEIRQGEIYVTETKYYGFGAGVQTELGEGQTLRYDDDGGMIVSGFNQKMTGMIYVVGMVSDHVLGIGGAEYSLTALCGKGAAVKFVCKEVKPWQK